jgi:hypothetical protein
LGAPEVFNVDLTHVLEIQPVVCGPGHFVQLDFKPSPDDSEQANTPETCRDLIVALFFCLAFFVDEET